MFIIIIEYFLFCLFFRSFLYILVHSVTSIRRSLAISASNYYPPRAARSKHDHHYILVKECSRVTGRERERETGGREKRWEKGATDAQ